MAKGSLHHLEVHPGKNGGISVHHMHEHAGGYGSDMKEKHHFGPAEHGDAMEHIHEHLCGGKDCDMGESGKLEENEHRGTVKADKKNLLKHGESTKHPGFTAVASSISKKEGVSSKAAGAILASRTRAASPAAKKANPRLEKVK